MKQLQFISNAIAWFASERYLKIGLAHHKILYRIIIIIIVAIHFTIQSKILFNKYILRSLEVCGEPVQPQKDTRSI